MLRTFALISLLSILALSATVDQTFYDMLEQAPEDVAIYQKNQFIKYQNQLKNTNPDQQTCLPFYKRLFYNINNVPDEFKRNIKNNHNQQNYQNNIHNTINLQKQNIFLEQYNLDMYIYFNTNISCPRSYVTIEIFDTKIMKFDCLEEIISLTVNGSSWQQYQHKCRILVKNQQSSYIDSFKYIVYGQVINRDNPLQTKGLSNQKILQFKKKEGMSQKIQIELVRKEITTKMIVLGDWAPIKIRPYFPIHDSLVHYIDLRRNQKMNNPNQHQYRIAGLIIAGDIAYNLQDFNGMKYNWFMSELERVSPYWPIIIFPGNHDDSTPGNRYLLSHSFDIGRLSIEDSNFTRVRWMRFPNVANFVMFDPYLEIYNKGTPDQTLQMTSYLKSTLNQIQNKYPQEFTIIMTHYPVACSQMTDNHCNGMLTANATKQLLDFMSTQRNGKPRPVDLYIGSHMHQFQRVFPYANGTFQIGQKSTYSRGHMVSVVEGAAGCDYGIISEDFPRQNFSVSATYAKTGYAFMTIFGTSQSRDKTQYKINYRHVAAHPAPNYYEDIDQFTIYSKVPQKSLFDQLSNLFNDNIESLNKQIEQFQGKFESYLQSQ